MMSTIKDFSKWKPLVREHLGKRLCRQWLSITLDILVVDHGIKPAFLFDYSHVTVTEILELLSAAHTSGLLLTQLCVVCVEMDVLIVGQKVYQAEPFVSLCDKLLVVDVSSALTHPQIVRSRERLKTTFEQFNLSKCFTRKSKTFKISPDCQFNPSTLFGLLLGYPVVYWYGMDSNNNCLSREVLSCHKVVGTLNEDCKEIDSHTVFSFSLPQQLDGQSPVESWFHQLQCHTAWRTLFKDITMTTEMVQLSCVCL